MNSMVYCCLLGFLLSFCKHIWKDKIKCWFYKRCLNNTEDGQIICLNYILYEECVFFFKKKGYDNK